VRQLVKQSGHSRAFLYRIIDYWLARPPKESTSSLMDMKHVIIDGTFLHRPKSIVVLMDGTANAVIAGKYDVRENSKAELLRFFEPLVERGLDPVSFTVDGNPQVIAVIQQLWPRALIQRCLIHVQRQGLMWCRRHPYRTDAKKLREIFLLACNVRTKDDRTRFLTQVADWEAQYGARIDSRIERGKVFSDIKRARSMLLKALPFMFYYLEDQAIPFSTNGLEGYFSRLKARYRSHRGLKENKRNNYFSWYLETCRK